MILQSLKLENIRSYLNQKIEFPLGSVLLSGDIGSGKSSILLAIEFALFGIVRGELSGSSLLRHGKNQGSVELKFLIGKDEYLIKRTLKRSKSVMQDSGYLLTNNKKFEGTPVELKAKIIEILGYPEELVTKSKSLIYRYTIYTPQEAMKQILFEDKDMRLDTLRKIFGIDKYKAIRENGVIFIRELKRKQSEFKIKIENYDDFNKDIQNKQSSINILKKEIQKINIELTKSKEIIEKEKIKLEKFETDIKKYNELKKKLDVLNMQLSEKNANITRLKNKSDETREKIQNLQEKLQSYLEIKEHQPEKELEDSINKLQDKLAVLIKEKSSANEKLRSINEQIINLEYEIEKLTKASKQAIIVKSEISNIKLRLEKKQEQEKLLEEYLDKEKNALIKLENINLISANSDDIINKIRDADICPLCNQNVNEEHRKDVIDGEKSKLKNFENEKSSIKHILLKITSNIQKIRNNLIKLSQLEKIYREKRDVIIKLDEYSKQLVEKQKQLSKLYESKKNLGLKFPDDNLKEEIDKQKKLLSGARDNNLKLREKKNISDVIKQEELNLKNLRQEIINQDIKTIKEKILSLSESIEKYSEINEKYQGQKILVEKYRENERNIEIKLSALNQERLSFERQIKEIQTRLKDLDKIKGKIKEVSDIQMWFDDFFLKLMTTIEKHVMVSIHKEFNSLLKEWFYILIDDIDITLDEEFSVLLIQDGYETTLDSLSGGEKTSVALSYRLALNKVINDLITEIKTKDIIILDEPTDGFSTEQLDKVRDVLQQLDMKQTIIVSHEPKMESFVENIIRISKSDNVSIVS